MARQDAPRALIAAGKVIDSWSLHLKDGRMVGTGIYKLADKADSVVFRYHFEGSKALSQRQ